MPGGRLVRRGSPAVEHHRVDDLPRLLKREDGLLWVDIPDVRRRGVDRAERRVRVPSAGHPDCVERNRVPKVHVYPDHVFVMLHGPELGQGGPRPLYRAGPVRRRRYLVTVHGPTNPAVEPEVPLRETRRRAAPAGGRPAPSVLAGRLSYAIVSSLIRPLSELHRGPDQDVWQLEQRVTSGHSATRSSSWRSCSGPGTGCWRCGTMATLSREVYGRMATLAAPCRRTRCR